jgi:hypothetical protein
MPRWTRRHPGREARIPGPAAFRLAGLAFCCLLAGGGCAADTLKNLPAAEMGTVKGQVLLNGRPLTGGMVIFSSMQGGKETFFEAVIDENGAYSITVPVGVNQIAVDNRMLAQKTTGGKRLGAARRGRAKPGNEPPNQVKGHYVSLPGKYANPVTSGLTWTVEKGTHTHDIRLD